MIESTLSTNHYPICNHHIVSKVKEEDEGHPLLIYPCEQRSKIDSCGLPHLIAHVDNRPKGGC